ncbi:hypothetical protein FS749_004054 [Ceratobasidium sp. UAMH 11750]|nr:hypothetical protein FS749_004054 [Ceratobasidium sp. UAMH 11750]
MLDITHVCTDWRKLAINTPLLWSHVDMRDSNPYEPRPGHEKVWLERARSVPLSVQAAVREESDKLPLLGPYLGAVHSLGFQSDSPSSLRAAFAYWMSNGTPGSVQQLSLIGPKKINRFGKPPYMDEEPGADLFMSFIEPLRVLRLRAVDLSNFILYEGLVHLELSYLAWYADPLEYFVASRLLGCPELRVLKLDTLTLSKVSRNWLSKPLNLNVLERLEIVNMSPDPCLRLLPMLAPGPGELDLRLEVDVNSQNEGELISFFSRSNVTKFYFKVPLFEPVRMDWMSAIPNLQMLVLDFNAQSHPNFRNSVLETLLCSETSTSRFPKLRTLWVIDYYVDIEILKRVVETCRIETLIISVYSYLDTRFMRQQLGHLLKKLIMEPALPHSVIAEWYSRAH